MGKSQIKLSPNVAFDKVIFSLIIFLYFVESLDKIIHMKVEHKAWKPLQMGRWEPTISHLFFVDDIIFAEASQS